MLFICLIRLLSCLDCWRIIIYCKNEPGTLELWYFDTDSVGEEKYDNFAAERKRIRDFSNLLRKSVIKFSNISDCYICSTCLF